MDYEQIKYETRDGILTITLNRPDKLNAMTAELVGDLHASLDRVSADPTCRVIVLTGYGNIATAVNAVKMGAVDYLAKPADADDVVADDARTEVDRLLLHQRDEFGPLHGIMRATIFLMSLRRRR